MHLLQLDGKRVEFSFGSGGSGVGTLTAQQPRLPSGLGRDEPAKFPLTPWQGVIDWSPHPIRRAEQRARAAALTGQQGGRAETLLRLLRVQPHQHFDLEFLETLDPMEKAYDPPPA